MKQVSTCHNFFSSRVLGFTMPVSCCSRAGLPISLSLLGKEGVAYHARCQSSHHVHGHDRHVHHVRHLAKLQRLRRLALLVPHPPHVVREDLACRQSLLGLEAHGDPGLALHHCLFVHVRLSNSNIFFLFVRL